MSTTNTYRVILGRLAEATATLEPSGEFTLTGGTTTAPASTSAISDRESVTAFDGCEFVIVDDAGGTGAPEGEARLITNFVVATGVWTVTPAFTASPASPDIALILQAGLRERMVRRCLNDIILNLPLPRYIPLTLVADGDMETSGDGNWAAVGAGTGTKATTAADTLLRQHLAIAGTSDGDGQRSDAFNVYEGETLYVDVALRCDTGEAQVELWNADTSAVIASTQYETNEEGFARITFQYAVETGVERISVQITQNGATALAAKVGWVAVLSDRRVLYDLPATVADASMVEEFMWLPKGGTIAEDATHLWTQLQPFPYGKSLRDYAAANSHRVELARPHEGTLFIFCRAVGTAVSAMTDTVNAPLEPLVSAVLSRIHLAQFVRTADPDSEKKHAILARSEARAYRALLDSLGLGQPIQRIATQGRISAA